MARDYKLLLEQIGAPQPHFWDDDLEISTQQILMQSEKDEFFREWIKARTGRQLSIIYAILGLDISDSVLQKKDHLSTSIPDVLLSYLLVDQFAKYKSKIAVVDFAIGVLPAETLDICRIKDEEFDKVALLFAIYHRNAQDLRLVFHLDKIHKSGFARMQLKEQVRSPKQPIADFLKEEKILEILSHYDSDKNDGRRCEFKDVIDHDGDYPVFIRREERPDHLLIASEVIHGYRPEWIILDFADNMKKVRISSVSVSTPLEIANRLASEYFGGSFEFENESQVTYTKQIERFLGLLKDKKVEELPLVELVVENSALAGSPKLKITDPDSNSIGSAIDHFEETVGSLLSDINNIESIKVYYHKKRISLIFEKNEGAEGEYVVRYSDNRLNANERRSFENYLRDTHGIPVLSTEKRFKH